MLPYQTPRATTAAKLAMPQNQRLARLRLAGSYSAPMSACRAASE